MVTVSPTCRVASVDPAGRRDEDLTGSDLDRLCRLRHEIELSGRVDCGCTDRVVNLSELIRDRPVADGRRTGLRRGEEQGPGQREMDLHVRHRQFLVDGVIGRLTPLTFDGAAPVEPALTDCSSRSTC